MLLRACWLLAVRFKRLGVSFVYQEFVSGRGIVTRCPPCPCCATQDVLIGVCRDLTGIIRASTNKKHYNWVFDALYPRYFALFYQAAEVRSAICTDVWVGQSRMGLSPLGNVCVKVIVTPLTLCLSPCIGCSRFGRTRLQS